MKKLFFLLIMSLSFVTVAQDVDVVANNLARKLTNKIVEESGGYISETREDLEGQDLYEIKYPSFYDFDLVRMAFSDAINYYSDIEVLYGWGKSSTDNTYFTAILVDDKYTLIFTYNTVEKYSMIIVAK